MTVHIGLVGDYNSEVVAHRAIPVALDLAGQALGVSVEAHWLPTSNIHTQAQLNQYDGIWCVPASPYLNMDGALLAIEYARVHNVPFLGTCGGFQHAVVEYARNVLGWADADHAETAAAGARLVVTALACSLVEVNAAVLPVCGSRLAQLYQHTIVSEGYHCRFGLNPDIRAELLQKDFRIGAIDALGDVRAINTPATHFSSRRCFSPNARRCWAMCLLWLKHLLLRAFLQLQEADVRQ